MDASLGTLNEIFLDRTRRSAEDTYLLYKPTRGVPYHGMLYREFREQVRNVAAEFQSLGLVRGDKIAVLSESRPEWIVTDFAALMSGMVTVPMFPNSTAKQVEYIVHHSGAKLLLVSNDLQLSKAVKSFEACPDLKYIVLLNSLTGIAVPSEIPLKYFHELLAVGPLPFDFESESSLAQPEDVMTIIYTSGTTGIPKGVMLTHKNFISNVEGALAAIPSVGRGDVFLSFLPLCHAFERVASYLVFAQGATVAYAESIDTVTENMLEVRPTVMTGVPRFFERVYARLMRVRDKMPERRRKIFDWAFRIGQEHAKAQEGLAVPLSIRLLHPIADKLVLSKIRERTGGRIRFFVSGAAALPSEVGRAFAAFGFTMIEGYGMTEASPVISVTPSTKIKWGTVGHALKNVELKIAPDGEILARGPNIMKGYFQDPEATSESIDNEGWLHTGDIGVLDSEGYLKITDRKKHILVSSGGKNIAPLAIELLLESSPLIEQAILLGDKRQYCTAIIVPEFNLLREQFGKEDTGFTQISNEAMATESKILEVMRKEIDRVLKEVASYERVRKFVLLPEPFTVENGMMTPTLKIKRKEVEARYAQLIESMYRHA